MSDSYTKKEKKNPRILLRKTSRKAELSFPDRVAFLQKKRKRISNDPFRSFEERRSNSIGVASTDTKGALSVTITIPKLRSGPRRSTRRSSRG